MKAWEYTAARANVDELVTELNSFGAEGWEAVKVSLTPDNIAWLLVFKRPVTETL